MDLDLSRAMHDAARTGTAHRPALPPTPVMQRIRRRRRVRVATESTVGVAAAGAVAFGTLQVIDTRDVEPVRPAVPTPSPTTTPPPSLPAVTPTGPFGCGLPVPGLDDPAGTADLHLDPAFTVAPADPAGVATFAGSPVTTLAPGERLLVDAALVNGTDRALGAAAVSAAGDVEVWFTRDGVTVGRLVATGDAAPAASAAGAPGSRWSQVQPAGVPTACAPDGTLAGELPLGDYAVYLVQALAPAEAPEVTVAGGPYPVSLAAPPASAEPEEPDPGTRPDPVDPHPAPEDLVISPAGLGPLAIGVAPSANPGAAMIEFDPDNCADIGPDDPGRWVASGYEPEMRDGDLKPLFWVAADESTVGRIDVATPTIRTAEGVGVGTTLTELRATYPALEGPFPGPVSQVWWLTGPTGTLVFETQGDEDGLQPPGTPEFVILMRVIEAGVDPRYATANSGDVAGTCL